MMDSETCKIIFVSALKKTFSSKKLFFFIKFFLSLLLINFFIYSLTFFMPKWLFLNVRLMLIFLSIILFFIFSLTFLKVDFFDNDENSKKLYKKAFFYSINKFKKIFKYFLYVFSFYIILIFIQILLSMTALFPYVGFLSKAFLNFLTFSSAMISYLIYIFLFIVIFFNLPKIAFGNFNLDNLKNIISSIKKIDLWLFAKLFILSFIPLIFSFIIVFFAFKSIDFSSSKYLTTLFTYLFISIPIAVIFSISGLFFINFSCQTYLLSNNKEA